MTSTSHKPTVLDPVALDQQVHEARTRWTSQLLRRITYRVRLAYPDATALDLYDAEELGWMLHTVLGPNGTPLVFAPHLYDGADWDHANALTNMLHLDDDLIMYGWLVGPEADGTLPLPALTTPDPPDPAADSPHSLATLAQHIHRELAHVFPDIDPRVRQTLALAEEAGEAVQAARRHLGMARPPGDLTAVATELADVVLTAFVTAAAFDIDLPAAINLKTTVLFTRGWRQTPPAAPSTARR